VDQSASGTSWVRGIFGFLINLPIVSYYEIGTALITNHGHAAMVPRGAAIDLGRDRSV
jgi:nitric oxide reductase large subunit